MILICYDGSEGAKAAIEHCGMLLGGQKAVVLTVWKPFRLTAVHTPTAFGFLPSMPDTEEIDRANSEYANTQAEAGAELARAKGFDAEPLSRPATSTTVEAILDVAEELNADAILLGSRGLGGLHSHILGSVSNAVVHHADRAVIVVPSPTVAQRRVRALASGKHENQPLERV